MAAVAGASSWPSKLSPVASFTPPLPHKIVTNRMISRMGFTVGIPLFIGLLFFPFFYYLKVGLKIDVPTWVPFIVSFIFFGTALLGVSYGIVSSSWDPLREGSFLGWNEAQKNWPVFWQSLRGGSGKK
ncbi:hypothetical protein FEM48_Zijuj11G0128900 [Ziziphus jujuba var. spinosa]|uniref:Protein PAM68, chloroplastic n=1 Tax=Ziziphus jujuba var. spinosa TaxID=714518 RepID=A0A978UJ18_ZIZJJ|nr:hypothetical protein FEM48_Zijuj11G0128900 [Ziziphus jujuba var. spinosa]